MCGIVGWWCRGGAPIDRSRLAKFRDSLTHRGPDSSGLHVDDQACFGLGHRRLAILDPNDAAAQPMSYASGRYWVVFNGEIYNFLEIRAELTKEGFVFKSDSDTEVVLAAYIRWGEDCQFRFNGMWAFAIWDSQDQVLFISRDRFGVKPLFFSLVRDQFIFASELKAFMALPDELRPEFDLSMLALMKNIEATERTMLSGVKNLNAGHCLRIRENGAPVVRRWWRTCEHLTRPPKSYLEQVEAFGELFHDSCRLRLRSDVNIATALSGGLDSSSIVSVINSGLTKLMTEERRPLEYQSSFVLVFKNSAHDESLYAKTVMDHFGSKGTFCTLDDSTIRPDDVRKAVVSLEAIQNAEPMIGPWKIYSEMNKSGIKVSLDGHGGDELLAGYTHYPQRALQDALWPNASIKRWRGLIDLENSLLEGQVAEGTKNRPVGDLEALQRLLPSSQTIRKELVNHIQRFPEIFSYLRAVKLSLNSNDRSAEASHWSSWLRVEQARPRILSDRFVPVERKNGGALNRLLYSDFHIDVLPTILRNFDRVSMAHGVESRAPFLDWRLVCFMFSLPNTSKLGGGFTKRILRDAMTNILPEEIRQRRSKIGFASPMTTWYQSALKEYVNDSLASDEFLTSEIWDGPKIREAVRVFYKNGQYQKATQSWKFLQAMELIKGFKECARVGRVPA